MPNRFKFTRDFWRGAQHATIKRVPQTKMQNSSFGRDAVKFEFIKRQCLQQSLQVAFFLNVQKVWFKQQPFRDFPNGK